MPKRKTLPNELVDLVQEGNVEEIIKTIDKCEVNAKFRSSNQTIFHMDSMPLEVLEYAIENGADIETRDTYGKTALHSYAPNISVGGIERLLKLGADVNASSTTKLTPLHIACGSFRKENVLLLIENGADISAKNTMGYTPLLYALKRASNTYITQIEEVAKIFFSRGVVITDEMKLEITRIGESFEQYREGFNKDTVDETSNALDKLYVLFDAKVAQRIQKHYVTSTIIIQSCTLHFKHEKLWEYLVPASGYAQTVQGEVIRISGKITREILTNGGMNWDREFVKMLKSFMHYLNTENKLSKQELSQMMIISKKTSKNAMASEEELDYMLSLAIKWIEQNPVPIEMKKPKYKR